MNPMNTGQLDQYKKLDLEKFKKTTTEIFSLLTELMNLYKEENDFFEIPSNITQYSHFYDLSAKILADFIENPIKSIKIQEEYLNNLTTVYFSMFNRMLGYPNLDASSFKEPTDDKRFSAPEWQECLYFDTLKKLYYLITKHSLKWLNSITTLDRKSRQQLHFYLKNILNFISPTNSFLMNPEVIHTTLKSGGENFLLGFRNYLEDLVLNKGRPNIRMTDLKAFKVGKNLAITPGKVVFQNDLMQLIQYLPTTEKVYQTPILFVPPWINKYYVLDLSCENSLVKWLVGQGFTVYMISWVNPDQSLAHKGFSDYMSEGPIQALDFISSTTRCPSVHMVGYCIGGTLLSCALAALAKQNDPRVASATFLMTLLNFSNPGELGVFIDKTQLHAINKIVEKKGYFDGRILDMAFNVLRPNNLIWPYFIDHYLLGKPSKPIDFLYWNSDPSNLPCKMNNFYLKNMYLHNNLRKPEKIKLKGIPINLNNIKAPAYFLASETDHITLWRAVYSGTHLLGGPVQFVLAASGHVMSVINPPTKNKYSYKIHKKLGLSKKLPIKPSDWLSSATECTGSWWGHWVNWLTQLDAQKVPARDPVQQGIRILEDAPGSYVLRRL